MWSSNSIHRRHRSQSASSSYEYPYGTESSRRNRPLPDISHRIPRSLGSCPNLPVIDENLENPNLPDIENPQPNLQQNLPAADIEANIQNPDPAPPQANALFVMFDALLQSIGMFADALLQSISNYLRSLCIRSEEFRPEDYVMKNRIEIYPSNSTTKDYYVWWFFKIAFVVNVWLTLLFLFGGISFWLFGEASVLNPHSLTVWYFGESSTPKPHSFKFENQTVTSWLEPVAGILTFIYWVIVFKRRFHDFYLFNIREHYIGFLSLDLIVTWRFIKALMLVAYGFHDMEKTLGDWSDLLFVYAPVFFSLASISMLKCFEHEFIHATGLINDFIIILVAPCLIQFYRYFYKHHQLLSLINGVAYGIPILFAYSTKLFGYIYRPHRVNDVYAPANPDAPPA